MQLIEIQLNLKAVIGYCYGKLKKKKESNSSNLFLSHLYGELRHFYQQEEKLVCKRFVNGFSHSAR